ncbi:MAG: TRAP transporter substrate-binding protein DctP, partial [Betaproteobacteria bacterium]|nr:TRAP transporter substrate-binding protein DctP [Betaproteobacteria bacterium]
VERAQYLEAVKALRPVLERQFRAQGKGVEYLWSESLGELIVLCRNRHMKSPADWKGLKVRTAGRWQAEQLRGMGVSTVAMDVSEQYIALQNRTIDCALLVSGLASALKVHEVAPKVTLLRMSVNFNSFIMNKGIYDKIITLSTSSTRGFTTRSPRGIAPA